jgi:hypothetical protein
MKADAQAREIAVRQFLDDDYGVEKIRAGTALLFGYGGAEKSRPAHLCPDIPGYNARVLPGLDVRDDFLPEEFSETVPEDTVFFRIGYQVHLKLPQS